MAASKKDYFGLSRIVSIILANHSRYRMGIGRRYKVFGRQNRCRYHSYHRRLAHLGS